LTALIASRLDALDAADRTLIHDAAVLGQSFTTLALAALSGLPAETVDDRLRGLSRREIVARDVDPRSPERGQYAFVQALIREVAYNTLARKDRKARHLAAARYFESLGSDELAGALAGHYLAAYSNAGEGPEADALGAQARIALRAAAERAAALGAHDQAITFTEQALEVTNDEAERAELFERAGTSASTAGRLEAADRFYGEATQIYERSGDREAAARCAAGIAEAQLNARHFQIAKPFLEESWKRFSDLWPSPAALELRLLLARAYANSEDNEDALQHVDLVLTAAEHANLVAMIARGLIVKGTVMGTLGRLREAVGLLAAAERMAREASLHKALTAALLVGGFHLNEVDLREASAKYREGAGLARRTGQKFLLYTFLNNIAYTGFTTGDWEEAMAVTTEALSGEVEGTHRSWLLGNELAIRASRGEDVSVGLEQMNAEAAVTTDADFRVALLDAQANGFLATGRLREAGEAWRQIVEMQSAQAPSTLYQSARTALWARDVDLARADLAALDATGVHGPIVETRRKTVAAGIAALEGRRSEAQALYREAFRGWKESGLGWDEALTGLDMALLLGEDADPAVVESTHATLERLGARPFIAVLDTAVTDSARATGSVASRRTEPMSVESV